MKYIAIIDEEMLSNFRIDDPLVMVATDKMGFTRGIQLKPLKTGHWIKDYDNSTLDGLYHCSVCGRKLWIPKEEAVSDYPYCHCGADMRGDE